MRRLPSLARQGTLLARRTGQRVELCAAFGARTDTEGGNRESACASECGAHDRLRPGDLVLTKDALYLLSYEGREKKAPSQGGGFNQCRIGISSMY